MRAFEYITELAASGRHHFTIAEARLSLGGSLVAVRAALRRLSKAQLIASPYRGFYVVVPPEYRSLGCLPPDQFVHQLMGHLGEVYHVALLSAAEVFGATHFRPQHFQVMVARNRPTISCGQVSVRFVARGDLRAVSVVEVNTPRGRVRVSSPEATLLELVGYADQCGGLENVVATMVDLVERADAKRLRHEASLCPIVWSQRLGYLLERIRCDRLAKALITHVREKAVVVAPLVRKKTMTGAERDERWKLSVNVDLEIEA